MPGAAHVPTRPGIFGKGEQHDTFLRGELTREHVPRG